jgi:hypothetical protein
MFRKQKPRPSVPGSPAIPGHGGDHVIARVRQKINLHTQIFCFKYIHNFKTRYKQTCSCTQIFILRGARTRHLLRNRQTKPKFILYKIRSRQDRPQKRLAKNKEEISRSFQFQIRFSYPVYFCIVKPTFSQFIIGNSGASFLLSIKQRTVKFEL